MDMSVNYKNLCPECGGDYDERKTLQIERYPSTDDKYYLKYIEVLTNKFGDNKWPYCIWCYQNMVDICDSCGMVLSDSPIFWQSSACKSRCSICADCRSKKN